MTRQTCGVVLIGVSLLFGAPVSSFAQTEVDAASAEAPTAAEPAASAQAPAAAEPAAAAQPETVKAVVRGLFVDARVGGGYMVVNRDVEPTDDYPLASGSEGLGGGSTIQIGIGFDLNDMIALQALGGAVLASGSRDDLVRDLSILFAGGGARVSFALRQRLNMVASLGLGYGFADNAVEEPEAGVAVFGGLGVEYYVHVRHFSVGVELSGIAPISPMRVFVAITPSIKYTF